MNYQIKKFIRNNFKKNKCLKELYLRASYIKSKYDEKLNDYDFAMKYYKETTGMDLNLNDPKTFDVKLWWLKTHNRDPLLTKCSDKYLVREYIKECGLDIILTKLYGVWNNANEIDFNLLPDKFYLKWNKGSGGNVACVNKNMFDKKRALERLEYYKKYNSGSRLREWNYKNIVPKIICEELLEPDNYQPLIDYKFYCF